MVCPAVRGVGLLDVGPNVSASAWAKRTAIECRTARSSTLIMGGIGLAKYTTIKVGKPLSLDDLKKKPAPRGRKANPRDEDLARLVNEVSVGPASQVIPWTYGGKAPTARLAANRAIKVSGATVYVSSRADMPGILLLSRVPLTGRQGNKK